MQKSIPIPERLPLRASIRRKAMFYTLSVIAVTAVTLTLCAFLVANSLLATRIDAQLSSLTGSKEAEINARLRDDRERTALLGSHAEVIRSLSGGGNIPLLGLLHALEADQVPILGISVFDQNGELRGHAGQDVAVIKMSVKETMLEPLITERGWEGHVVVSPIHVNGNRGAIAVRYSVDAFLPGLLSADYVGASAISFLGRQYDGNLQLLNFHFPDGREGVLTIGAIGQNLTYGLPMARAVAGHEGAGKHRDHRGVRVLSAYRAIPSLGWGLVTQVDASEALRGVVTLAAELLVITAVVLLLAAVLGSVLVRHLTDPIMRLSDNMALLQPGHWTIARTVKTGDEVELLETVAADMAKRLKKTYDSMETEIASRTAELRKQYLQDRIILESIDHGVILVDKEGRVTGANPAALGVLKCDEDRCLGQNVEVALDIRLRHHDLRGNAHPVRVAMRKKQIIRSSPEVRYSIMREDNILIPVSLVIKPLVENGRVISAVVVFQDITEERRVDYLKSEFISLASHQLRTPLSSLQWYLELFADEKSLTADQKEYLKEMETASHRMSNLIDALLHAARLEGGNIQPRSDKVDVSTLIADLAEELRVYAKEKGISCSVDFPKSPIRIMTDSVLLHVVFKNLFSNAVKYTKNGGKVGVVMASNKDDVIITVRDTGIGIPKGEQKRLFERLFRASNVRNLDTDGNGLGLYITKMIVVSLGGSIAVESAEGKGTAFTVRLPLRGRPPRKSGKTTR